MRMKQLSDFRKNDFLDNFTTMYGKSKFKAYQIKISIKYKKKN